MSVLPQPGRAVEQDALRRLEPVLTEQVGVQERQLDGVADLLDLRGQAADVVVVDVRDLFEDELLDLGPRDLLEDEVRARLQHERIPDAQLLLPQRAGQLDDALLVGVRHHQGAVLLDEVLEDDDLAGPLELARRDHVERLVEHDLLPGVELRHRSTVGLTETRILRPELTTSTVPSSAGPTKIPNVFGGWARRSTSAFSATIWSRASRSVEASRSFWAASWPTWARSRASCSRRPRRAPRAAGRSRPEGVRSPHAAPLRTFAIRRDRSSAAPPVPRGASADPNWPPGTSLPTRHSPPHACIGLTVPLRRCPRGLVVQDDTRKALGGASESVDLVTLWVGLVGVRVHRPHQPRRTLRPASPRRAVRPGPAPSTPPRPRRRRPRRPGCARRRAAAGAAAARRRPRAAGS